MDGKGDPELQVVALLAHVCGYESDPHEDCKHLASHAEREDRFKDGEPDDYADERVREILPVKPTSAISAASENAAPTPCANRFGGPGA